MGLRVGIEVGSAGLGRGCKRRGQRMRGAETEESGICGGSTRTLNG